MLPSLPYLACKSLGRGAWLESAHFGLSTRRSAKLGTCLLRRSACASGSSALCPLFLDPGPAWESRAIARLSARPRCSPSGAPHASTPAAECPPQRNELPPVVGGVVRDEQQLAQAGLAVAPRYRGEEIGVLVEGQLPQRMQVALIPLHARIPFGFISRRYGGPVALRPRTCHVVGVHAEVEDVGLRQTYVLGRLPAGVSQPVRHDTAKLRGKVGHGAPIPHVGSLPVQLSREKLP